MEHARSYRLVSGQHTELDIFDDVGAREDMEAT
jgi:hypothetical protein